LRESGGEPPHSKGQSSGELLRSKGRSGGEPLRSTSQNGGEPLHSTSQNGEPPRSTRRGRVLQTCEAGAALTRRSFVKTAAVLALGSGITGAGASLAACSNTGEAPVAIGEDGSELPVVRAWTHPGTDATPYLVGEQKGFFAGEGLVVELTPVIGQDQYLPSVLDGTNDVGDAHPNELAMFVKEGAAVRAVCRMDFDAIEPEFADHRHMRFYVRSDSPLRTWSDVKAYNNGGEVIVSGHDPSCMSFVPRAIFKRFGLGVERLRLVYFGDPEALQALDQGAIDIAQIHAAYYALAERSGYRLLGDSVDAGVGRASGTALYYFRQDYIDKHPDRVQKFVNAITLAQRWIDDPKNFAEGAEITAKGIGVDVAFTHYFSNSTAIVDADLQFWVDQLVEGGYISEGEVTVADMVTHDFFNPEIG
jgi:ABC-type nitrate/sulfonate/bicarbonate transport system substrate-binding protein